VLNTSLPFALPRVAEFIVVNVIPSAELAKVIDVPTL
jgi:hypothetical protein